MKPYRIIIGDVRASLATLPDASVQLCMTSPPYWALRSYLPSDHASKSLEMGSEPTPEAYIAGQVEVFRAVRRVLRDDGVLVINLGSTYASRGTEPTQSRTDARPYGNDGTTPQCSLSVGRVCPCCGGELQDDSVIRRDHTAHISQQHAQSSPRHAPTTRDTAPSGLCSTTPFASPLDARRSTTPESSSPPLAGCSHCAMCGVFLSETRSTSPGSLASTPGPVCTCGKCEQLATLGHGIVGTSSLGLACGNHILNLPRFKTKDLIPMPWLVALALVNDGWYLRQALPWVKRSSLPESVTDRPASAVEYVFLLSKSARYYWDCEAVKQKNATPAGSVPTTIDMPKGSYLNRAEVITGHGFAYTRGACIDPAGRNFRNADLWFQSVKGPHGLCGVDDELVGLDVTAEPTSENHFAAYPSRLVEPFVKAGTSERGCCPTCGTPWERVSDHIRNRVRDRALETHAASANKTPQGGYRGNLTTITLGWQPGCTCPAHEPVPCTVLDPFSGTGTTGVVACRHGRHYIGCELFDKYAAISERRLERAIKPHTARSDEIKDAELFAPDNA